jgi:hypothetical protein
MALAGTELIYSDTAINPDDARQAALHAVSRVRRHELPEIMAMLGLKDLPVEVDPDIETCRKGHPWSVLNTRIRPNGRRLCRTCERIRDARKHT